MSDFQLTSPVFYSVIASVFVILAILNHVPYRFLKTEDWVRLLKNEFMLTVIEIFKTVSLISLITERSQYLDRQCELPADIVLAGNFDGLSSVSSLCSGSMSRAYYQTLGLSSSQTDVVESICALPTENAYYTVVFFVEVLTLVYFWLHTKPIIEHQPPFKSPFQMIHCAVFLANGLLWACYELKSSFDYAPGFSCFSRDLPALSRAFAMMYFFLAFLCFMAWTRGNFPHKSGLRKFKRKRESGSINNPPIVQTEDTAVEMV